MGDYVDFSKYLQTVTLNTTGVDAIVSNTWYTTLTVPMPDAPKPFDWNSVDWSSTPPSSPTPKLKLDFLKPVVDKAAWYRDNPNAPKPEGW